MGNEGYSRKNQGERRHYEWHQDKKLLAAIIAVLLGNSGLDFYAEHETDENLKEKEIEIRERLVYLEFSVSEIGKSIQRQTEVFDEIRRSLEMVAKEQARRTPAIRAIERHMDDRTSRNDRN